MDDKHKYMIIEKVRQVPLLWDPEHVDYNKKDKRQQAWEKVESDVQLPIKGMTVKQTWEAMNRAFNSAMRRRKKKKTSGHGGGKVQRWKFERSMGFLKTIKAKRNTSGMSNLEEIDESISEGDENASGGLFTTDGWVIPDDDDDGNDDSLAPSTSGFIPIPPKPSSKRKATDYAHDDARAGWYNGMAQRMEVTTKSPRLKFFESIMPQVDELTDECFLDFQIGVLSSLRRFRQPDPAPDT